MKKSTYILVVLGTASGVLMALGICMALVPEWDALWPGVILGCAGLLLAAVTVAVWRRQTGRGPVRVSGRAALTAAVGIAGALVLGTGMCLCMVWDRMALGIAVGLAGIAVPVLLIPLVRGLRD